MSHDDDHQGQQQQDWSERIIRAPDGYPQSWSFGASGSEYKPPHWRSRASSPFCAPLQ
jgi:hypothetical protein